MLPLKGFDQLLVAGVDVDPARRPAFVQRRGDTDEFTNGSFAGVPDGLGAVGGYAALSDYTALGGQLTVFKLPD